MQLIRRFIVMGAVLAVSIAGVAAGVQECTPTQFQNKEETWYYPPFPEELVTALQQCYTDVEIAEFDYCFSGQMFGEYAGESIGCGNDDWYNLDPWDVDFAGVVWMNPIILNMPEGAICATERTLSYWEEDTGFGIWTVLRQITGGTGAYEDATGIFLSNPTGRVSAKGRVHRLDGWLCTP